MTTLSDGTTTITLPDDLLRTDEYGYSPVRQSVTPTLTGALWVDVSTLQTGEPITISGGRDDNGVYGAITRTQLAALRAMANQPGQPHTLTYCGQAYTVIWRHHDAPAVAAEDVVPFSDLSQSDFVIPTLKFTVIS